MSETGHTDKKIIIAEPEGGLVGFTLKTACEMGNYMPLENIITCNKNFDEPVNLIKQGTQCDLIIIDAIACGLIKEYSTPTNVDPMNMPRSFNEFDLEELEKLNVEQGQQYDLFSRTIRQYKREIPDFRGIIIANNTLDDAKETIAGELDTVIDCVHFYYTDKETIIDPLGVIVAVNDALNNRNFMKRRKERKEERRKAIEERDKAIIKESLTTMLQGIGFAETREMPEKNTATAIPPMENPDGKTITELLHESETLLVDLQYDARKGHDALIYLRSGFEPFEKEGVGFRNPKQSTYPGILQLPGDKKRKIDVSIPSIRVHAAGNGINRDMTLMWIKEINEWLVHDTEEGVSGLNKPLANALLATYNLPAEKIENLDVARLSPRELKKLARNSGISRHRKFLQRLLYETGFRENIESAWFERNIQSIELMPDLYAIERGFTGLGVLLNDEWAIKFDAMPRIGVEHKIYTSMHNEFRQFCPRVKGFDMTENGEFGAIILENVGNKTLSGYRLASRIAEHYHVELKDIADYNLFMMGLFHKYASDDDELNEELSTVPYEDKRGIIHPVAMNIPMDDISNDSLKRFHDTEVATSDVLGIITDYNEIQDSRSTEGLLSTIHGDWKPENMVNGYVVDFAMVGLAYEVDELAYYLSDSRFKLGVDEFHEHIDKYIQLRSAHDPEFHVKVLNNGRQEMHALADSAFLRQLVLRHSVMKKRDLTDDSKYKERQYYQHRINEVLRQGDFI